MDKPRKQIGPTNISTSKVLSVHPETRSRNQVGKRRSRREGMGGVNVKNSAAFLVFMFMYMSMYLVNCVPKTEVKVVLCNGQTFTAGDPFTVSLDYVIEELENSTSTWKNYDFYNISPYPNSFAYGHASCNQNLTNSDCTNCVGVAKTNLLETCQMRIGGRAVLHDCAIRYEQYPFAD